MNRYLKRQHLLGVQDNQTTCLTSNTSTLQGNESSEVTKIDSPSTDSEKAENCSLVGGVEYEARLEAEVFTLSTEAEISQASRYWVPDAHSKDVVEHTIPLNNSKQIVDAAMQTMDLPRTYTNEWAVKLSGGRDSADEIASKHGFENRGLVAGLSDVYMFALRNHPDRSTSPFADKSTLVIAENGVEFAEQQHLRVHVKRGYSSPTDPNWSKQWPWLNTGNNTNSGNIAGRDINVQPAWIQGYTGCNVYVGVVDDGVECTHPDLLKNYIAPLGWNFLDGTSNPFPGETEGERDSHGTGCAGEVGMTKSNSYCGAGVAYNAGITGIRLLGNTGVSDTQEANGLSHLNNYIHIYSNSWGPTDDGMTVQGPGTVLKMAFQNNAASGRGGRGSIYVWAAGNGGQQFDSCAADGYVNSIYTIPIGAASSTGEPAYYDEPCSGKMAVAFVDNPYQYLQVSTTSTFGLCTDTFDGTSSATPLVSGVLALVLEANPSLTWRDIQYLIVYTANPNILSRAGWKMNGAGRQFHLNFGFGAIDTEAMVTRAKHWVTVPAQVTSTVSVATASTVNAYSSRDYSFTYTDAISYLEHVVIRTTLTISGVPGDTSSTSNRGDIYIQLVSPNGTLSTLLPFRMNDIVVYDRTTGAAYSDWPFKSLHFWGENPAGTWKITVVYNGTSVHSHSLQYNSDVLWHIPDTSGCSTSM
ncbi:hypothetical protein EMCRGX_G014619 [Ephydatia muelleri]